MNVLIVEDEVKVAKLLAKLIQTANADASIAAILQSVDSAVEWLSKNEQPDIIFMDIQLADGLSFEIFEKVDIVVPVIFCSAFNDYFLEAFKNKGLDYILKPFTQEDIESALGKLASLKHYFQKNTLPVEDVLTALKSIVKEESKNNFLVYNQNSYVSIATSTIAYFYKTLSGIYMVTDDKKKFLMNESLDELHRQVGKDNFYRINRQYLIAFKNVIEVQHYFERKLIVKLNVVTDDKLLVGREKVTEFLSWLANR